MAIIATERLQSQFIREQRRNNIIPQEQRLFTTSQNTEVILTAQYMLSGLGYDIGTPDGVLGVKTQQAILFFQREQSLLLTGRADQTLLLNLAKATQKQLQKVG